MATQSFNPVRAAALGFIAGCAVCAVIGLAAAVFMVGVGAYDVTARDPHAPLVEWALHATMIHAEQRRAAEVSAPPAFSPQAVATGAQAYNTDCASCHGAPGVGRASWVAGLTPSPPYLIGAARKWSALELYSIIGDGVKMTAMPAWRVSRSDQYVWNMVAFLEALPSLSPQDYARLRTPPTPSQRLTER